MPTKLEFQIEETVQKNRLDSFLFDEITAVSKIFLRNLIQKGGCRVNGAIEKAGGYHLRKGDVVGVEIDLGAETAMMPENIPLEIVFEDEELIVVNKPAGMLVHPTFAQKSGTLLNALAFYLNSEALSAVNSRDDNNSKIRSAQSAFVRPGLVHRLDRETSGLIVAAKTKRALRILSIHFGRRLVEKKYLALVEGVVENDAGVINAPIGRFEDERRWNTKSDGKSAETRYVVEQRFTDRTLLSLVPVTGRTNQLRIHCAFIGHPIVGDKFYNGQNYARLCLHAAALSFWHPNGAIRINLHSETSF